MPVTVAPLPLTGDPYQNVDERELDDISAVVQDGLVDETGSTVKRPGYTDFVDTGTGVGIDGAYWWHARGMAVIVSAGRVFKITDAVGTKTEITGSSSLVTGVRVSFEQDGTYLYMANGGKITYFRYSDTTLTIMADPDAPQRCTQLGYLDGYILANNVESQSIQFSNLGDGRNWNANDFFATSGRPDYATGLAVTWREVTIVGPETTEVWINDGVTPFSRLEGGFIERGASSPDTLKRVGDSLMFLDDKRRFVLIDNRRPVPVSLPYDKLVQSFSVVSDAFADVMEINGKPLYVCTFPAAGKTLVYDYIKKSWAQWGYWNLNTAQYDRFRVQAYCYARNWNLHLVGDFSNGKIYSASSAYYDDAGNPIRTLRRTGHISHGVSKRKQCHELAFRLARGAGNDSVADPQMMVRWRNDAGRWRNEHWLSIGQRGHHELYARMHKCGQYRSRQYEIAHSDSTAFILNKADEEVEVLET